MNAAGESPVDDARARILRDTRGSGKSERQLLKPDQWPVLSGMGCALHVLDEDDAASWRPDADDLQLVDEQEFVSSSPGPYPRRLRVDYCIRLRRVAWACGGGLRHFGVWTLPGGVLAGGVELRPGSAAPGDAELTWVIWPDLFTVELAAEAVRLAVGWAKTWIPGPISTFVDDGDAVRMSVLRAIDFEVPSPAHRWRGGRSGGRQTAFLL